MAILVKTKKDQKGRVWVDPHVRAGEHVEGYWREGVSAEDLIGPATFSTIVAKSAKEMGNIRADLLTEKSLREFEAAIPAIRALPVRRLINNEWYVDGERVSADQEMRNPTTIRAGGVRIDKYDFGDGVVSYSVEVGSKRAVRVGEDEWVETGRRGILERRGEAATNWTKVYRGKVAGRKAPYLYTHKILEEAIAENDANPKFRAIREWAGIPDYVVLITDKGHNTAAYDGKDIFTTAFRDPEMPMTHAGAEWIKHGIEMKERNWYKIPKLEPGMDHATRGANPAGLMRHEWAHSLWVELGDERREEFYSLLPKDENGLLDSERMKNELTRYSAAHTEYTDRERKVSDDRWGPHGYVTEAFSEALTVATHPDFNRDEWAPWVGEIADWIERLPSS